MNIYSAYRVRDLQRLEFLAEAERVRLAHQARPSTLLVQRRARRALGTAYRRVQAVGILAGRCVRTAGTGA